MMDTSSYDELSFLHFNDVVSRELHSVGTGNFMFFLDLFQYHFTQTTAVWRLFHVFRNARNVAEAERPITGMLLVHRSKAT